MDIQAIKFHPVSKQISCQVNGQEVIISANEYENICVFGCFEDVGLYFDDDQSFKRMILYLRALVFYELSSSGDNTTVWAVLYRIE